MTLNFPLDLQNRSIDKMHWVPENEREKAEGAHGWRWQVVFLLMTKAVTPSFAPTKKSDRSIKIEDEWGTIYSVSATDDALVGGQCSKPIDLGTEELTTQSGPPSVTTPSYWIVINWAAIIKFVLNDDRLYYIQLGKGRVGGVEGKTGAQINQRRHSILAYDDECHLNWRGRIILFVPLVRKCQHAKGYSAFVVAHWIRVWWCWFCVGSEW